MNYTNQVDIIMNSDRFKQFIKDLSLKNREISSVSIMYNKKNKKVTGILYDGYIFSIKE